jgi:hypothetical protein
MAHRKTRAGVVQNPVNENWVRESTLNEWHSAAKKQAAIRKEYEKTHPQEVIRIDNKTVIFKNKTK